MKKDIKIIIKNSITETQNVISDLNDKLSNLQNEYPNSHNDLKIIIENEISNLTNKNKKSWNILEALER